MIIEKMKLWRNDNGCKFLYFQEQYEYTYKLLIIKVYIVEYLREKMLVVVVVLVRIVVVYSILDEAIIY